MEGRGAIGIGAKTFYIGTYICPYHLARDTVVPPWAGPDSASMDQQGGRGALSEILQYVESVHKSMTTAADALEVLPQKRKLKPQRLKPRRPKLQRLELNAMKANRCMNRAPKAEFLRRQSSDKYESSFE